MGKLSLREIRAIGAVRYYTGQSRNWFNAIVWVALTFVILGFCLFVPTLVKESHPVEYTTQQGDIISIENSYATFNGELIQKTEDFTFTPLLAVGITLFGVGLLGALVVYAIDADREAKARGKFAQQWLDNNLEIPE